MRLRDRVRLLQRANDNLYTRLNALTKAVGEDPMYNPKGVLAGRIRELELKALYTDSEDVHERIEELLCRIAYPGRFAPDEECTAELVRSKACRELGELLEFAGRNDLPLGTD